VVFLCVAAFILIGAIVYIVIGLIERNTVIEVEWVKSICLLWPVAIVFLVLALIVAGLDALTDAVDDWFSELKIKINEKRTEKRITNYEKLCGSFDSPANTARGKEDDNG